MAHTRYMLDNQDYTHARSHAHARAQTPGHPHTHVRTQAHVRTQICNTYCFSTATMIRERALMLRCTTLHVLFIFTGFLITMSIIEF